MAKNTMTFEQVDKHVQSADLSVFQPGGKYHLPPGGTRPSPATVSTQVCAAYQIIRPILALIISLPFFPKKWKEAVKVFMQVMDVVCPVS